MALCAALTMPSRRIIVWFCSGVFGCSNLRMGLRWWGCIKQPAVDLMSQTSHLQIPQHRVPPLFARLFSRESRDSEYSAP